ncbi:MAG: hypothetical protein ACRECA_07460, partial [Pseudolabrys sp.]
AVLLPVLIGIASFAPTSARADCTQNGSTVNCAPPGTGGFTAGSDGLTLTVQPAATVQGADGGTGINLNNNNTATNSGTIAGGNGLGSIGISVNDNNTLTNFGTISVGTQGTAVQFIGAGNTLENYGTVSAGGSGLSIEACPCTGVNNVFNNHVGATLDGMITLYGADNSLNNSGLIVITNPATSIALFKFTVQNTNGTGSTDPNIFTQTASGTLALRMDSSGNIDSLLADQVVAGGTLRVVIQPQLYPSSLTSSTSAVDAVYGPIIAPFDHYTSSSPFFAVIPIYDSGDPNSYNSLSIQLDRLAFNAVPGMTPNEKAVGNALEPGYSTGLTGTAATFYGNLLAATSVSVLDHLSGEGTSASQGASFGASGLFTNAMMQQGFGWLNGTGGGGVTATFGGPLGYAAEARANDKPGYEAFAAVRSQPASE